MFGPYEPEEDIGPPYVGNMDRRLNRRAPGVALVDPRPSQRRRWTNPPPIPLVPADWRPPRRWDNVRAVDPVEVDIARVNDILVGAGMPAERFERFAPRASTSSSRATFRSMARGRYGFVKTERRMPIFLRRRRPVAIHRFRMRKYYANAALRRRNMRTAGFLGVEHKFYDTSLNGSAIANPSDCTGGELDPSSTSMISTPAVGDGENNRDGRKIVIESVHIRGHLARTASQSTSLFTPTRVVLFLVLDTQTNAAQMNSEDCFKALYATADGSVDCHRNLLFGNRFRILKKLLFTPTNLPYGWNGTTVNINGLMKSFEWHVRFPRGLHINFNAGTTASIANVIDNSLHLIGYAGSAAWGVSYGARIRFQG